MPHYFHQRNGVGQRGTLEHQHHFVGVRGEGALKGIRQQDRQRVFLAHAQRPAGLPLSFRNGTDRPVEQLGGIGRTVQ